MKRRRRSGPCGTHRSQLVDGLRPDAVAIVAAPSNDHVLVTFNHPVTITATPAWTSSTPATAIAAAYSSADHTVIDIQFSAAINPGDTINLGADTINVTAENGATIASDVTAVAAS